MPNQLTSFYLQVANEYFQIDGTDNNIITALSQRWTSKPNLDESKKRVKLINLDGIILKLAESYAKWQVKPVFTFLDYVDFLVMAQIDQYLFRQNTCLLHGSAVSYKQGAVVFLGQSGAGKTTILQRLRKLPVLADDSVVVVKIKRLFWVYPSPFDRGKVSVSLRPKLLQQINILEQGFSDRQQPITTVNFLQGLIDNSIYLTSQFRHPSDKHLLQLFMNLVKTVSGYRFFFRKSGPLKIKSY